MILYLVEGKLFESEGRKVSELPDAVSTHAGWIAFYENKCSPKRLHFYFK